MPPCGYFEATCQAHRRNGGMAAWVIAAVSHSVARLVAPCQLCSTFHEITDVSVLWKAGKMIMAKLVNADCKHGLINKGCPCMVTTTLAASGRT